MRSSNTKNLLAAGVFLLLAGSISASGKVVYVDADAPGVNNGSSWTDAYLYLQDGLKLASPSDEIRVAQGIYTPDSSSAAPGGTGSRGAVFQLINEVSLLGGYAGFGEQDPNARNVELYETVLSGDLADNDTAIDSIYSLLFDPNRVENSYNVVTGNGTDHTAVLDGFTITGGSLGGMVNYDGSPTVINCTFTHNWTDYDGAGMCNDGGSPTVVNCTFSANAAWDDGGGLYSQLGSITATSCTFSDNWAYEDGAGICVMDCSARLVNCRIGANIGGRGGGMSSRGGSLKLINCTFGGNSAGMSAAGLRSLSTNAEVTNCIFWDDSSREIVATQETLKVTYSNIQGGWPGEGNIDADPKFFFDGDLHLSADSPCIDSGTNDPNGDLPASDADGNARVLDGDGNGMATVDMGAYEYNRTGATLVVSDVSFELRGEVNEPGLQERLLLVGNAGGETLAWELTESCPWLSAAPPANQLIGGGIDEVTLTVDASGLGLGRRTCNLEVSSSQAINGPQNITVVLHVTRSLHIPGEYAVIQDAIDAAMTGDIVLVADGVYTGDGNKNLDFAGKAITLASVNGAANCIIDCEHDGRAFYLHSRETEKTVIDGFTICNGSASIGAGMYNIGSSPTVKNCIFRDNVASSAGGGMYNQNNNPTIVKCRFVGNRARGGGGIDNGVGEDGACRPMLVGCVFVGNRARWGAGMSSSGSDGKCVATIIGCTFAGNVAEETGGGLDNYGDDGDCEVSIENCIMWGNSPDEIYVEDSDVVVVHSDIQGGWLGQGNIDADPCFASPGWWADVNDANTIVQPNDPDAVWADGDYHLKSRAGRWDTKEGRWITDEVTSPCIDAGDPMRPVGYEPFPSGGIVNMGAYGGTAEASKSYFDKPLCKTIVAGDINGDCIIDFEDFRLMALHWCEDN
ncbi:MAG: choice-of-anchor Q domain-containing protein [Planctomycetota bacterium]|jgi:hypothetical protein